MVDCYCYTFVLVEYIQIIILQDLFVYRFHTFLNTWIVKFRTIDSKTNSKWYARPCPPTLCIPHPINFSQARNLTQPNFWPNTYYILSHKFLKYIIVDELTTCNVGHLLCLVETWSRICYSKLYFMLQTPHLYKFNLSFPILNSYLYYLIEYWLKGFTNFTH